MTSSRPLSVILSEPVCDRQGRRKERDYGRGKNLIIHEEEAL